MRVTLFPSPILQEKPAGEFEIEFNGNELPDEIYFNYPQTVSPSTVSRQSYVESKKMVLLK